MKRPLLFGMVALAGCTSKPQATCLAIETLARRNPIADARSALAKGDHHLLMLGGFAGSVPGVENPGSLPTQMIEGTSEVKTDACADEGATAEAYAAKYNRTVVEGSGD